ncbi:hypothetical protein ACDF64_17240 [Agromyces sp. MMS24-JH15]|uniref:hypothetical protein n=1 Tax=Agromyces sp. MMS24-JH15 TaxID=3243765 RepID=UPI00374787FB
MSTARTGLAAALLAASVVIGLSGCFNPVDAVQQGVEDAVEGAVEGATGGDVQIGGDLPEGFPTEVPLVDGEIVAAAGTGDGWVVTIRTDAADPVGDAVAALEAAGYVEDPEMAAIQVEGAALRSNGTWNVLVAGDTGGVAYTVTPVQ